MAVLVTLAILQWLRDFLSPKAAVNEMKDEVRGKLIETSRQKSCKVTAKPLYKKPRLPPILEGAKDDEVPKFTGNSGRTNQSYQPYVSGRRASVMAAGLSNR